MIPAEGCGTVGATMATPDAERLRSALRTFFARIKKDRSISQSGLCALAKVSESTVRAFLAGHTKTMQHDTLEKLAAAAGETVDQMLGAAELTAISPIDNDKMHALLVGISTVLDREKIRLPPRDFADLVMAIYGIARDSPAPFVLSPEVERLIL